MDIKGYVLSILQKKYSLDQSVDLESFNYVESGYVDSLGLLQFIVELEDKFSIEFTDDEMTSPEFHTVGGIVKIIEDKVKNRNEES